MHCVVVVPRGTASLIMKMIHLLVIPYNVIILIVKVSIYGVFISTPLQLTQYVPAHSVEQVILSEQVRTRHQLLQHGQVI